MERIAQENTKPRKMVKHREKEEGWERIKGSEKGRWCVRKTRSRVGQKD